MAPNGHTPSEARSADRSIEAGSRPPTWLKKHGSMEFKAWQKEHPSQSLSYKDWQNSKDTGLDGLSLYYAALQIWDGPDSSDEEVEARPRDVRGQSAREPKKTLKTNGTGAAHSIGSATPNSITQIEDQSSSTKRKRKARKKYLSQELVASEESEDVGTATPITEATTPSAPINTANGRRKSSNRKPRKKPISEETISPEDEEEDPMAAMNAIATPAIASPLPVRSAPKASTAGQPSEPPRKHILKLSTRKTPKKKVLSEETVRDEDTDEGRDTIVAAPSTITTVTEPNISATTENHTPVANHTIADSNEATASPDPTSESASATRRGLRTRRPAQQRPYSYDAQIFEDHDEDASEEQDVVQPSPNVQSRRVSVASVGKSYTEDKADHLDEETLAILQGDIDLEPVDSYGRAKHFKGKGRAWKKEESDEDLEFNPGKKKAARAKAKAKALAQQQQPPKKRGRPRKSVLSEDVVRDDSDDDATVMTDNVSPSPPVWEAPAKKTRKPPRKSALSEAIVVDETDEDVEKAKSGEATNNGLVPQVSSPAPKKRGRPRKSDQSIEAKISIVPSVQKDEEVSSPPKGTPKKSNSPKDEPKLYTPKVEPEQVNLTVDDIESEDMDLGGSSQDGSETAHLSHNPPLLADVEAHMADVNAADTNEETCKKRRLPPT